MTTTTWSRRRVMAAGLASAAALAIALAGCSSGKDTGGSPTGGAATGGTKSGPLEIVYLQKQGDQQYFVDEGTGAKKEADKLGDVKVTVVNLGTDSNKAISELDSAIARKVDGIVMVAPDQAIGPQVIDKAKQAGIPFLASDDILKDSSGAPSAFVGFDGTAMGNKVGEKAAELYKAAGWSPADTKILSVYKEDLSVCKQRVDGAKDTFQKTAGALPEVIDVGTDNSVTDALNKTGATITAHLDVKHWLVWGCNDESETGAVTALQNASIQPANIIGVGLGAYLTCKDWKANQDTGNKAALYISGVDVGTSAIQVMVDQIRNGKTLPAQTIADTHMVDKTNWQQEGVACT